MNRRRFRSVRTKFLLGCLVAIVASGIVIYASFSSAAEKQSEQSMRARAVGLAENTAFLTAPLIAFESRNEMTKALKLLAADPDFAYALISDETGRPLASIHADGVSR